MAVAFRSASDMGDAVNVTSRAVPVPAGAAVNDIAVVVFGRWDGTSTASTITPPSGFTQKDTFTSGDGLAKGSVWWKRLTAADSGTYSFSWTASHYTTAECELFSGCVTTGDPFDGTPTKAVGTFGTFTTLSQTLSGAGGGLVWACYNDSAGTHTPPTGFTETADNDSGSMAYRIPGSAGSQSAASGSVTSSSSAGAWLGALLEAGGGGGASSLIIPRQPARGLILR